MNIGEQTLGLWAKGPAKTEDDKYQNAINAIKDAINNSSELRGRNIKIFLHGSYKNRVNVRQDSDVDVGVLCTDAFFPDYPEGTSDETFNNHSYDYSFSQYKNEVEIALVNKFGRAAVKRGNKAFDIKENTYRVEADVAPFFEHRRYSLDGNYLSGIQLIADKGGQTINWPEQHYENGVDKHTNTGRRYKKIVRITKKLCVVMQDDRAATANSIPGFLIECLIWNVPNDYFGNEQYSDDLKESFIFLHDRLGKKESDYWGEASELKYLFRKSQKWTKQQAREFIEAAWNYVGF